MELVLDAGSLMGLVLGTLRVGAFAFSSPITRAFPAPGRLALSLAVGWALASPVQGIEGVSDMVTATAVNLAIGVLLGFLTGIILYAFQLAGSVIDLTSGLAASAVFDPLTGNRNAVLARFFNLTAIVLWLVMGGDRLAIEALGATVTAIPLDGSITFDPGLADLAVGLVSQFLLSAVALAAPALAALFLTEVGLGIAARFSPQANVFAIGLPAKLLVAVMSVSMVMAAFPSAIEDALGSTRDTVIALIRGLGGA